MTEHKTNMYQTSLTKIGWQYIIKVLNLQARKRKYDLKCDILYSCFDFLSLKIALKLSVNSLPGTFNSFKWFAGMPANLYYSAI